MIPYYYEGVDRIYGDVSIECADKVLDMIDNYIEIKEAALSDDCTTNSNSASSAYELPESIITIKSSSPKGDYNDH